MAAVQPQKKLFRIIPPKEFVETILRAAGLLGLHDLRWFSKDELVVGTQDEWLPLLYPYYLPCKARRFMTDQLDGARFITVLRHILRPHGYDLHVQERLYRDQKQSLYQIQPIHSFRDLSGVSLEVVFS
jgi:hypothetical protein